MPELAINVSRHDASQIVQPTGWQKHRLGEFVSTAGSEGEEKIESSNNAFGKCGYRVVLTTPQFDADAKVTNGTAI